MNPTTDLLPPQPQALARTEPAGLSIEQAYRAVVEGNLDAPKLAVLKELLAMDAERRFAAAFVALQDETPNIKAVSVIPNNDGGVRSRFAPYEEIMEQVAPLLQKHGFTVTFSTDFKEGRIIKICTLQHIGGHSRSNQFAVRVGSGPPKASEAQADGAASTYAKRFALCDALNIVVDRDTDARVEGAPITKEQAAELEHRVAMTNSDRNAFLKFAGAKSFAEIMDSKYAILDGFLARKEGRK